MRPEGHLSLGNAVFASAETLRPRTPSLCADVGTLEIDLLEIHIQGYSRIRAKAYRLHALRPGACATSGVIHGPGKSVRMRGPLLGISLNWSGGSNLCWTRICFIVLKFMGLTM